MASFSRLKYLTFVFDPECKEGDYDVGDFIWPVPNYNQRLQHTLFGAISKSSSTLRLEGFCVHHLLSDTIYPHSLYTAPEFAAVLASLKTLCIEGLSNGPHDFETGRHDEDTIALFSSTIPRAFLAPTQPSLTSLNLVADQLVEFWLNFDVLFYPNLQELALSHMMFDGTADRNTGVEGFILRHQATLTSLSLNRCPMYLGERPAHGPVAPARWGRLWGDLAECPNLVEVCIERANFEYVIHDAEEDPILGFWCPADLHITDRDQDGPSFEHLQSMVAQRGLCRM